MGQPAWGQSNRSICDALFLCSDWSGGISTPEEPVVILAGPSGQSSPFMDLCVGENAPFGQNDSKGGTAHCTQSLAPHMPSMPDIPEHVKCGKEDQELKVILRYLVSLRPAWAMGERVCEQMHTGLHIRVLAHRQVSGQLQ